MKILHIAPNAPYNEGWSYQENLLPKYQAKLGHVVTLIITNTTHDGSKVVETKEGTFQSEGGFKVIRLKKKKKHIPKIGSLFTKFDNLYSYLLELKSDFVFFHGVQGYSILDVIHYKKEINNNLVIVQDNHLDYNIGFRTGGLKKSILYFLCRWIYRRLNRKTIHFVEKVYGVTPWRKTYAEDFFGIPKSKTDVLIMGADDEKINFPERAVIRQQIRGKYQIDTEEFLILSGGKIEDNKRIDLLIKACTGLPKVRLLLFGNIQESIKEKIGSLIASSSNTVYIGWIQADNFYDYCFAADLVAFPGQHSVLWEQACATKTPCIFARWEGMDHVNNGGNSAFFESSDVECMRKQICDLIFTEKYYAMKKVAESGKTDIYLYSNIAKKSLECAENK